MECPFCSNDSHVTNSRLQKRHNSIWRRRECLECSNIWTTIERIDASTTWRIAKNGKILTFHYETLYISLYEVLKHRKTPPTDATYVTQTVVSKLSAKKVALLPADTIAQTAYDILRRYDKVAAALYKAVYL